MPVSKVDRFDISGATTISVNGFVAPTRAIYSFRLKNDVIEEFYVANPHGPNSVWTTPPGLTPAEIEAIIELTKDWHPLDQRRAEYMNEWVGYEKTDGSLVFPAPTEMAGGQPIHWAYDKRLQIGISAEQAELERISLGRRHSLVVNGLKA